jgi:iron complex outermembrane receptor protein
LKKYLLTFALLIFITYGAIAKKIIEKPIYSDSIRVYKLGTVINVTDDDLRSNIPSSPTRIGYNSLKQTDAQSLSQLAVAIPSTFFQTNSRGEALIFIRGVGDRRTEVFWDGILLNLPWDRRYDLQMVPSNLIGNVIVSNGSASVLYGSNTMGGSVDIATMEREEEGFGGTAQFTYGDGNMYDLAVTHDGRFKKFNYITNVSYFKRGGLLLDDESYDLANSDSPEMIAQNDNSKIRTNSDEERLNIYSRGEYAITDKSSIGLSFLYTIGEKGVVPEGFDDDPRCWRYPEYSRSITALNFNSQLTEDQHFKAVVWFDQFDQMIDSYTDMTYSERDERVSDEITTFGTRLAYDWNFNDKHWLTASASSYFTSADETTSPIENQVIADGETLDYSELLYDLGLEYRIKLIDNLVISAGGLFSGQENPKTGEYIELEGKNENDFSGIFGAKYFINANTNIFANVSRKVSYPSLRQAYANDPKKYAPNPDLAPEHGVLSEIGMDYSRNDFDFKVAGFYNSYTDMIVKSRLKDDSEGRKYIRENLAEGYIAGLETIVAWNSTSKMKVNASLTAMQGKGKENGEEENLNYVPDFMGNMSVKYRLPHQITPSIEMDYIGKQFDGEDEIDPSFFLNARVSYILPLHGTALEVFVRCNNILDEQRIQQLGLPAPGRTAMCGIKVSL